MLTPSDTKLEMSTSVHSLSNINAITIPGGQDSSPNWQRNKNWVGVGVQGLGCPYLCNQAWGGMSGLTFDGTGLFGSGLFSGDISTWGISEMVAGVIGVYAIYSMVHQGKQTKYRFEGVRRKQRVSKAAKLRAKAKQLEEKTTGIF
jgi:hypothetical protein